MAGLGLCVPREVDRAPNPTPSFPQLRLTRMQRPALIAVFLVFASLAAYWPVHRAEFTNFDDPLYVTNNPKVFHGLTAEGLVWAFTAFHGSNWHPLTWLSHMVDCQVFGENAAGHHWVNVGFHVANTLLLFLLLRGLTGGVWRSAFVAALFALHPLHVESVAWVSERKDVLSTFFALLTLLAYARYVEVQSLKTQARSDEPGPTLAQQAPRSTLDAPRASSSSLPFYLLSLLFFALGLLSKPMLVTLPFVMLLLDYWPLQRLRPSSLAPCPSLLWPLVLEKLPFLALSAASSVVTFLAQSTGGAVVPAEKLSLLARLANASVAYLAYLCKTFWPAKLSVYYPLMPEVPAAHIALAMVVLCGLTAAALSAARRAPYVPVGWFWFIGTLIPVIGLVQVGSQAMADRYTYFPLIGLLVSVAWGATDLTARWRYQRLGLGLVGAGMLVVCFACTWVQVGYWRDSITLFSYARRVTQRNALTEHNLGHALSLHGRQREAIEHFDEALRLKPGYPQVYYNRGNAYGVLGELEPAIADYREAVRNKPDYEQAYCNLAKGLALQDKLDEALTNFLAALRCKPDYAEAHTKLGNVLLLQGAVAAAMPHLYEAVRIDPTYAEGHYYLAAALARQKKFTEAVAAFRAAIRAKPDYASALNDLAWLLATRPESQNRDVPEAVRLARRACELTQYASPAYLDTLAVAESEAGQLTEAAAWTEKAVTLAATAGDGALAAQLQGRLAAYRAGHSYTQGHKAAPPGNP